MKKADLKEIKEKIEKERAQKFKQKDLPETLNRTLFVSYGVGHYNAGCVDVLTYEPRSSDGFESVVVGIAEAVCHIEKKPDIKGKLLKVLEKQKQDILAENHQRLKIVQDKIDNLLALTHEPEA